MAKRAASSSGGGSILKVACIQFTATEDRERNFAICKRLVTEAATDGGAKFCCLPECFHFIGNSEVKSIDIAEALDESNSCPTIERYKELAGTLSVGLSLGGFQESDTNSPGKVFNTHFIISPEGEVSSVYRKMHLFDYESGGLMESSFTSPGNSLVVDTGGSPVDGVNFGVTTCYDLRFPCMYDSLCATLGANVLLVPAAFTVPTGRAHWEILLRARAIETQSYVLAAAQIGQHNAKRASFGMSMIIDPWGKVIGQCDALTTDDAVESIRMGVNENGTYVMGEVDLGLIRDRREKMPLAEHSRFTSCERKGEHVLR